MRYDVKKFLFVGIEDERAAFFERAQDAGIIHFIKNKSSMIQGIPDSVQNIVKAIKVVRGLPPAEQEELEDYSPADSIVEKILILNQKLEALNEEFRIVSLEKSRVEPFGDFTIEDISYIEKEAKRHVQFYVAKRGFAEKGELPPEVIYVTSDNGLDYFVAFNKQGKQYPKLIEVNINRSLGSLKVRLEEMSTEKHDIEQQLKTLAKYNQFLHHALTYKLNDFHLKEATDNVQFPIENKMIFAAEGWVPAHKISELQKLVSEMNIHIEEIASNSNETPPTYLENKGASRLGEDLVHIYDTPSHRDQDPSIWVLIFFSLFFAMIIGDGGYGLVMLLVSLYIRNKHSKLSKAGKRVLDLFTILSFSVIAWGVLTTSFFGVTIAPDNEVRKVSLMSWLVEKKVEYVMAEKGETYHEWVHEFPQLENVSNPTEFLMQAQTTSHNGLVSYDVYNKFADNIMMEMALMVGVIHVILSMLRYIRRNPQNIGWVIFLIGAYLYIPYFLDASSILNFVFGINRDAAAKNGIYLMSLGGSLAFVIALFKHKLLGLLEPTVVIQIFGDVLSYLRLYALGLAGSLMTATMNEMAASVPLVFGIIILVLGHAINIVLAIQGGVIHGLRLNFLEWYHYSFEGDGKLFNALKKLHVE